MENKQIIDFSSSTIDNVIDSIGTQDDEKYYKLIENYEVLVNANINNVKILLTNEKNKSVIMYNFGLLLELFLKMILLKSCNQDVRRIGDTNHVISNMFKIIFEKCNNSIIIEKCKYIKDRIALIEISKGKKIDYNDYADFRYNHAKGSKNLIFTDSINEKDKKHIREALECIESVMK